jgi:putative hemolysin
VGVVHVKDLLGRPGDVIDDFVRPPYLVSPMKEAAQLFEEMRHKRVHMALICSDRSQLMGIITLEDLIEKVMGEIHDEAHDRQFPQGEPP